MPLHTRLFPSPDNCQAFGERRLIALGETPTDRPRDATPAPVDTTRPTETRDLSDATNRRVTDVRGTLDDNLRKLSAGLSNETSGFMRTLKGIVDMVLKYRNKRLSPETNPETRPDTQIDSVTGKTKLDIANVLNPLTESSPELKKAIADAQSRFGLSVEAYQKKVMMADGEAETPEKFCRPLLSPPNGEPKTLVLITGGNGQPLIQKEYEASQKNLYDRFAKDKDKPANANVDVLQFKVGNVLGGAENHTSVGSVHIQNIVNDALAGRGQFAGRKYTSIRMIGYSYGAGHSLLLADQLTKRRETDKSIPPVDKTAFVDGIQFQSLKFRPDAVTTAPQSGSHLHAWQNSGAIQGRGIASPRPGVTQIPVTGSSHRDINDYTKQADLFDKIYEHTLKS